MAGKELVIASNNAGKLREMQSILEPLGFVVRSQREAGVNIETEETGETFAENAKIKAAAIYAQLHCAVIADDSGLVIDALDGAPGVHSHRFAGEDATDAQRNAKVLELLKDIPTAQRTARFVCVICYLDETGAETYFTGTCEGSIGTEPLGENGFGYDPIFMIGEQSMAQMTDAEKNAVSHRGNALNAFQAHFEK